MKRMTEKYPPSEEVRTKGISLAHRVEPLGNHMFRVPASTPDESYIVTREGDYYTCECPHGTHRPDLWCSHKIAVLVRGLNDERAEISPAGNRRNDERQRSDIEHDGR